MKQGAAADLQVRLRKVRRLVAAGTAAITPVVLSFSTVAPPQPDGITKITAIVALFLCISAYAFLGSVRLLAAKRWLILCVAIFCISLPGYLLVRSLFTFKVPTTGEVVIVGCGYTENAKLVATANHFDTGYGCPGSFERMLEGAQYNPYEIWDKTSLGLVYMTMLILWFGFISALIIGATIFVELPKQSAARSNQRRANRG